MTQQLHIVVSCTDRKKLRVEDALKLGNVPSGTPRDRQKAWWDLVKSADGPRVEARELYAGELWRLSTSLQEVASKRGCHVQMWVASAGLGLVPFNAKIPGYSATFARSSKHSVLKSIPKTWSPAEYREAWWDELTSHVGVKRGSPRSIQALAESDAEASILVVAGPDYIRAMRRDLVAAARELDSRDQLTVISSANLGLSDLEANLVPVESRAQAALGGTLIGLHGRTASALLQRGRSPRIRASVMRRTYAKLVEGYRAPRKEDGQRLDEPGIRTFIHAMFDRHPGMCATPMLRKLRDEGFACEQKRFAQMHKEIAESRRAVKPTRPVRRDSKRRTNGKKGMRYFLPDARDMVDPSFNFENETRSPDRIPGRDDLFAHEVFKRPVLDGMLVSMGVVAGLGGAAGKYSQNQRLRLKREHANAFFRASAHPNGTMEFMGDCGAFTYVKEETPPFSVDDVANFYERNGFHYGISVDHIILDYDRELDEAQFGADRVPAEMRQRQELTLELAQEFLARSKSTGFKPIGVAQGWSPQSYAHAVQELQRIGYDYVAIGGVVPLKTPDILEVLSTVNDIRRPKTRLHLLGVTRVSEIRKFAAFGVASFDSTSPLRRAWTDNRANYFTMNEEFMAIRVPQVTENNKLKKRIATGEVTFEKARAAEERCLALLAAYDRDELAVDAVLEALEAYAAIHDPDGKSRTAEYRRTLTVKPWRSCPCDVCKEIGHHVILFRGAERNRRRGFHNTAVFYQKLQHEFADKSSGKTGAFRPRPIQQGLPLST